MFVKLLNIKQWKSFTVCLQFYIFLQYNDYMALEMKDGYIVFKFDLGEGPGVIRSNRTYNDGLWHEVIAIRTGKSGTLTVR